MIKNCTNSIIAGSFIAFSTLFASCYSSQQFVQPSLSQNVSSQPQYLENLSIKGPERSLTLSSRSVDPCNSSLDPASGNSIKTKYAAMLRVVPETILNLSLYKFIDEWYGVRYRLGGNSKSGIDCSAFVQRAYEQVFGLNLLRTALDQFGMSNLIWRKEQCKEGDLVFFNIKGSRISHVGIYLMNNFFVHASSSNGIMISSLDDKYWSKYYACAGRVL
jgi:lipoprotein Spr